MAKPGPEAKLLKKMRDAAKKKYGNRIVIVKYHGSVHSEAGVSDLLICLDGNFAAVEVKAPENYGNNVERAESQGMTLKQMAFLRRVNLAEGLGYCVASVEHFLGVLEELEE